MIEGKIEWKHGVSGSMDFIGDFERRGNMAEGFFLSLVCLCALGVFPFGHFFYVLFVLWPIQARRDIIDIKY